MNIRNTLFVASLMLLFSSTFAQDYIGYNSEMEWETHASIQTDYQLGANALSNQFFLSVWNKPYLERSFLQDYDARHDDLNRLGYVSESELYFHLHTGYNPISLSVGLSQTMIEGLQYTDDAYHLVFFGNKDFVGTQANLSDIRYRRYNYSSMQFMLNFHSYDLRHNFSLISALHMGNSYNHVRLRDAEFRTTQDASLLELEGDYFAQRSGSNPGYGGSFGMQYSYQTEKHYFKFSLTDIGRIYWKGVKTTKADTGFTFDGFEIHNLFQADAQFSSIHLDDTLSKTLNSFSETGTSSLWLPIHFQLEYIYKLPNDKWDIGLHVKQRFMAAYKPYFRLNAYHHFNDKWHMSGILSYGGYGGLNVGASGLFKFHPKMQIAFETQYLSSLILFSQTAGLGGFINFSYQL